jgi:hypothetical protein
MYIVLQRYARHADMLARTPREHSVMNLLKRLWQWYRDRRVERHLFKGHGFGESHRSQGTTPVTHWEEEPRFARLRLVNRYGRR